MPGGGRILIGGAWCMKLSIRIGWPELGTASSLWVSPGAYIGEGNEKGLREG